MSERSETDDVKKSVDWRDVFCGRDAELMALVDGYLSVASGAGPRLAAVCADRGMGKTRLVQELYRAPHVHARSARARDEDRATVGAPPCPIARRFCPAGR